MDQNADFSGWAKVELMELNERRVRAIAVVKLPEGYVKRLSHPLDEDEEDAEISQVGDDQEF